MPENDPFIKVKKSFGTVFILKFLALLSKLTRFWLPKLTD